MGMGMGMGGEKRAGKGVKEEGLDQVADQGFRKGRVKRARKNVMGL
jgi:hypothetical protein